MKFKNHDRWSVLLGLFCVLLLSAVNPPAARAQDEHPEGKVDFDKELEETSQLIVMLSAEFDGAPEFGAGIIFGRDKDHLFIATAYHVLHRGAVHPVVHVKLKSAPKKALVASLLKHDAEMDLAVLSIGSLAMGTIDPCALPFAHLGNAVEAKRGDAVSAVGNPNGIPWAISVEQDHIAQTTGDQIVFQSTFIRKGHSGGGLVDENADLIGMTTADEPPFGRALNLDVALRMMKQWGYPVQLHAAQSDGATPLHLAAQRGDVVAIRNLLADCGSNPNAKAEYDATPLHFAAREGNPVAMALLLKAGADPNARYADGRTPLMWAIDGDLIENVKFLIKAGADVNVRSASKATPLHNAVESKQIEIVRVLLNGGARVNSLGGMRDETPLKLAVEHEQIEMITMLLEAGAKADLTYGDDATPLHLAVQKKNLEIVKLLVAKHPNLEGIWKDHNKASSGYTALHLAMGHGTEPINIEIVKVLIKAGANLNTRTPDKEAPLHWAARANDEAAIRLLIEAGADVNVGNTFGRTPLVYACREGHLEAVKILRKAGATGECEER